MNIQIKQAWIDALRSGKYIQTCTRLSNGDRTCHCCLGVLCEVMDINPVENYCTVNTIGQYTILNEIIGSVKQTEILWKMNDLHKNTFAEIAQYIETNL